MFRVLIIEDDRNLADVVSHILIGQDYLPEIAYDGVSGLQMAREGDYDIILLDLMLPGVDGLEVCKALKEEGNKTPIIMVTARSSVTDRITGFDAGADDYIPKPFSPRELLARIKATLRLSQSNNSVNGGKLAYGDLTYNTDTGEIDGPDDNFCLSEKERLILGALMENPGEVCEKEALLDIGWGDHDGADINNVEAYISFLRKRLAFVGTNVQIKTIRGVGYKLEKQ